MNTFRILSLIALVGVSAGPVSAGLFEDTMKRAQNSIHNAATNVVKATETSDPVAPEILEEKATVEQLNNLPSVPTTEPEVPSTVTEKVTRVAETPATSTPESINNNNNNEETGKLAQIYETVKNNCGNVIELAQDHPYYSVGVAAIIVLGGIEYFVFKNGHITTVKETIKAHPWITASVVGLTITAGGAYIANQMGYIDLSATAENASAWGSWAYSFVPSVPESVKDYLGWKTAATVTGLAVTGLVANKYFNDKTEVAEQKPQKPLSHSEKVREYNKQQAQKQEQPKLAKKAQQQVGKKKTEENKNEQQPKSGGMLNKLFGYSPSESTKKEEVTVDMLDKALKSNNPKLAQTYFDTLTKNGTKLSSSYKSRVSNLNNSNK